MWSRTGFCSYFVEPPNPKFEDNRNPNDRTLRDVVDDRLALFFEYASCERLSQSDLLDLVWRFGPDTKIETIRFKVVCSRCRGMLLVRVALTTVV